MNYQLLLPLLVTTVVGIIGWFIVHRLAAARDRKSRRCEQRIQYLAEAFRRLVTVGDCQDPRDFDEFVDNLKPVIADIQLFGTPEQVKMIQAITKEVGEDHDIPLDDLLNALRQDLRKELCLTEIEGEMWWLKITQKSDS